MVGRYQWVTEMEDPSVSLDSGELGIRNSDRDLKVEEFLKLPRISIVALLDNIRTIGSTQNDSKRRLSHCQPGDC